MYALVCFGDCAGSSRALASSALPLPPRCPEGVFRGVAMNHQPHVFTLEYAVELALQQAAAVVGRTSPNPPVGAVVVRDGQVVGLGATQPAGGPHAERIALAAAGERARGADLYTTLEPCTFYGRTPPCTEAIIAAGIRRVFFIAHDPDPRMGDGAAAVLQPAGIEVYRITTGAATVAGQLAPFRCRVQCGRPLVTAKYAMTLDGRIATASGDSRWITDPAARAQVHRLRDQVDVIMVGVGTIRNDDPQLTTRLDQHWREPRHPLRVIVDSRGQTPLHARVVRGDLPGQTLIACVQPEPAWLAAMQSRGVRVVQFPPDATGRVALAPLLHYLAHEGYNHLLVEGGAMLLGALHAECLIDEIWAFIGARVVNDALAPGPMAGPGVACMAMARRYRLRRLEQYDQDALLIATAVDAPWWDVEEVADVYRHC